jgi:hypothetical protein
VDPGAEFDRRAGAHEHLGRALDVEALIDPVGDVVDPALMPLKSGTRPRSCVERTALAVIVAKTANPGSGMIAAV